MTEFSLTSLSAQTDYSAWEGAPAPIEPEAIVSQEPVQETPKKGASFLERFAKLDADGTNKIMKAVRASMWAIGEIGLRAGYFALPRVLGLVSAPHEPGLGGLDEKGIDDLTKAAKVSFGANIDSSRKTLEAFIDVFGSKGLGHLFSSKEEGIVQSFTAPKEIPYADSQAFKEKIANTEARFDSLKQYYQTTGAIHNVFKLGVVSLGITAAVASLATAGSALAVGAGAVAACAGSFRAFDALFFDLPAHIASTSYHSIVTFTAAKEGFVEGFYQHDEAGSAEALKAGLSKMYERVFKDEYIFTQHLLVAVRFGAQTGLVVGLGLAGLSGAAPALATMASVFKGFGIGSGTAMTLSLTEALIGGYRSWIKTAPKDNKPKIEEQPKPVLTMSPGYSGSFTVAQPAYA